MINPRQSHLAYVVIRLAIDDRDCYLLREHAKWGDWSLVGGHVEAAELGDWAQAARREAEEELEPLRNGEDFEIVPLSGGPKRWGPTESRSAGGAVTVYEAEWFALTFLRDPVDCLGALPRDEFLLVDGDVAVRSPGEANVSPLLARLDEALPHGLASVPLAWPAPLRASELSTPVRRATPSVLRAAAGSVR